MKWRYRELKNSILKWNAVFIIIYICSYIKSIEFISSICIISKNKKEQILAVSAQNTSVQPFTNTPDLYVIITRKIEKTIVFLHDISINFLFF